MPRDVFAKIIGTAQEIKNKSRKSLQTLQVSADEQEIARKNMVLPDEENVPSKKKQPKAVEKEIATEKENAPILRRSNRKAAVSHLLNYAESPDGPIASKSVSVKTKQKKAVVKLKKGRQTVLKQNKPEINLNQTKLNFSPVTSLLRKSADVSEPAKPEKSILGTSPSSESEVTKHSGFGPSNEVSVQNSVHSTEVSEPYAGKNSSAVLDEETSVLTSTIPPLSYWKDLAELRRSALEKALRENELIYDQLTVLEAENSQLKQLLKEAENLAQVVRGILE